MFAGRASVGNQTGIIAALQPLPLQPGTRLGPYEILSALGAGGMGEVYRARDTRLNRDVALKIVPDVFVGDPDRLARFTREAQTLAALNHPNIAAIYGIEESAGARALVMELVDGEDLSAHIARGPMPLAEALPIARQIINALEAAHEAGIVHRDLKPANILLRRDGTVKVLDFGLAKALDPRSSSAGAAVLANSPTIMSPAALAKMTSAGVILGTAAYMAPEQARGKAVDKRADLWAFGVVLFEMLTGNSVFAADTVSDVLAAVLTREVSWTTLPADTPEPIRRLLRRCLEKDPSRRLADAASARLELDDALSGATESAAPVSDRAAVRGWGWTAWRVVLPTAAVTALIVGALGWLAERSAPLASERFVLTIVPNGVRMRPVGTMGSTPQISPDGSALMFEAEEPRALFVRRLDSLDLLKVPGSEAVANEAFWHGSSKVTFPVAAGAGRKLLEVRLPDGAPDTIMSYSANVRGGSWSGSDVVVGGDPLLTRGADGAGAPVTSLDGKTTDLRYPQFLNGGKDLLGVCAGSDGDRAICLTSMGEKGIGSTTVLFKNDTAARYTPAGGGRIFFVRNDNLYSQHLNLLSRAVEGEAELVVRNVASQPALARADFDVADNGTIAWRPGHAALAQVVAFNRQGAETGVSGPAGPIESVYLSSADESRLLVTGESSWLVDVGEVGRTVLPRDVAWDSWSADGRRLVGYGPETNSLLARDAAGGSTEVVGRIAPEVKKLWSVSRGGLVLGRLGGRVAWARVADLAVASAWKPLAETEESQVDASFSPDGRFALYLSDKSIYVQPLPGPSRRQLVAQDGVDPVWRADGKEILFVRKGAVWSVAVSTSNGVPTFGNPVRLFGGVRSAPSAVAQSQSLAVSRDGSRIFLVQGVEQPEADLIHVMTAAPQRQR